MQYFSPKHPNSPLFSILKNLVILIKIFEYCVAWIRSRIMYEKRFNFSSFSKSLVCTCLAFEAIVRQKCANQFLFHFVEYFRRDSSFCAWICRSFLGRRFRWRRRDVEFPSANSIWTSRPVRRSVSRFLSGSYVFSVFLLSRIGSNVHALFIPESRAIFGLIFCQNGALKNESIFTSWKSCFSIKFCDESAPSKNH